MQTEGAILHFSLFCVSFSVVYYKKPFPGVILMSLDTYLQAESTVIEFKELLEEKKPKSWLKTVSAFANTKGGAILTGSL